MPRIEVGRPRTRPDHVLADRAYTSRKNRRYLRRRGIRHTREGSPSCGALAACLCCVAGSSGWGTVPVWPVDFSGARSGSAATTGAGAAEPWACFAAQPFSSR